MPSEPRSTALWTLSASALARLTRMGEISASAATEAALARLDAVNPWLNAVVDPLAEQAMARADALDTARAKGAEPGPLFGVPVTIKINVDQKDCATSNGVAALKDVIAPDDAPVVRNLLDAGAVVIGRTNTPEFSFRAETDNPLYGRTRNPWGDHVSVGGSSGGSAAAVMAGICALGHGNDIGGSLRFPAAATGAVTIKPGLGRVPAWNPSQKFERGLLAQSMSVQGVLARSADDLALAMPVLIAPDPRDPFHVPMPWAPLPDGERPCRVGVTRATFGFALHSEVTAALDAAEDALKDAGYELVEITMPAMPEAAQIGYRAILGETRMLLGRDVTAIGSPEIVEVFEHYFREFPPLEGADLLGAMAQRSHYARIWSLQLHDTPLLLTPFLPHPFYRPGRDLEGTGGVRDVLGAALWSYVVNFVGLPAGLVPSRLSQTASGPQPVAVQIVGQRWREDRIVAALRAIEARVGPMAPHLWARGIGPG